ncbi:MAG: pyridoxamine 5'-phosphate oxidase family protein [Ilumatobacteraceae bacterium]|jgi:PPOX class probable F420-dependent enzyme
MPKLTDDEVTSLFDEPGHLARIATVDDDGMPRVVPLWFIVRERQLLFTPRQPAIIWRNLLRDPRVGMSIDEEAHPWRKVTVQGTVEVVHQPGADDLWRDLYRDIARRYVPVGAADEYVDGTDDQPRALCAVDLDAAGTRVTTWRMPRRGEDIRGVWHQRYYAPGTRWSES